MPNEVPLFRYLRSPDISLHPISEALELSELRTAIESIAAENYTNSDVLLGQEYKKNDRVYIHRDVESRIDGFFMVGWSRIEGVLGNTVFLGLSSVTRQTKGKGVGKSLYTEFFQDATEYAKTSDQEILWWFHSATPAAPNAIRKIVPYLSPDEDGAFSDRDLENLTQIKNHFGMAPYTCRSHPFVLRGYAKARYAPAESDRIASFLKANNEDHIMSKLRIDEGNGDRIMFLGRV